jgi:hypothetical protein
VKILNVDSKYLISIYPFVFLWPFFVYLISQFIIFIFSFLFIFLCCCSSFHWCCNFCFCCYFSWFGVILNDYCLSNRWK